MKLYAISDLHLRHEINRKALETIPPHPDDWLIVAGDVGEIQRMFHETFALLTQRFAQVLWVPGNHDLWTIPSDPNRLNGVANYQRLVNICHEYGVLTPEDPYPLWTGEGGNHHIAPIFTLYDYSFRPDDIALDKAVDWAVETGVLCTDEALLHPDPYGSRIEWCAARCQYTEQRLSELDTETPIILIGHFPLREDLIRLRRIPRFSLWCGTKTTHDWHTRFPISTVVYGHLHIRATDYRDGVRFEEVSLGYPKQWDQEKGISHYLREILPATDLPRLQNGGPIWYR